MKMILYLFLFILLTYDFISIFKANKKLNRFYNLQMRVVGTILPILSSYVGTTTRPTYIEDF